MVAVFLLTGLLACQQENLGPDIVIISVDTLRTDYVGAYNSSANTPNIDSLISQSVLVEKAFAPISVTGPSFVTLHTGLQISEHGVAINLFRGGNSLSQEVVTFAEILQQKGYNTSAFVSSFTLRPDLGLDQGFDTYDAPKKARRKGNETLKKTLSWIKKQKGSFFTWFHTFDVHGPLSQWYDGSKPTNTNPKNKFPKYQLFNNITDPNIYQKCYQKGVEEADLQTKAIIDILIETGRWNNTIIVFVSDHGESFTERELWFDHGTTAYQEQIHVPLSIKLPNNQLAGTRIEGLVSLADVAPTLLSQIGFSTIGSGTNILNPSFTGHDIILSESSHCKEDPILTCAPKGVQGKSYAARQNNKTLVIEYTEQGSKTLLFDTIEDPKELSPIDDTPPEGMIEPILKMKQDRITINDPDLIENEETKALRALGYIN